MLVSIRAAPWSCVALVYQTQPTAWCCPQALTAPDSGSDSSDAELAGYDVAEGPAARAAALAALAPFRRWPLPLLRLLGSRLRPMNLPDGSALVRHGESVACLHILLSGAVGTAYGFSSGNVCCLRQGAC
jgi:hypothetical protein